MNVVIVGVCRGALDREPRTFEMAENVTGEFPSYLSCVEWDEKFQIIHTKAVYLSSMFLCIINGVLAVHAFVLNSLVVALYFKDKRFQTTANLLILALALSDLFVALLTQPAAIVNAALKLKGVHSCISEVTTYALTECGVGLSCFTVCFTISLERLVAICWPLRHRVFVTKSLLVKTFLAQVLFCVLILPVVLYKSLVFLLNLQSYSMLTAAIFMITAYVRISTVIHKRSQTFSENSTAKTARNASQDNLPSNSKVQNDRKGSLSQTHKPNRNLGKTETRNSDRDSLEILSHDSKHQDIVSHGANVDEIIVKDLLTKLCHSKACTFLRNKSALKLKKEVCFCKAMAMIAGALAICFFPRLVIFQCVATGVISTQAFYNYLLPWLDVLAYANSSFNPYIYFFHNKDITEGVKKIVFGKRNARPQNNRVIGNTN